MRRIIQMLKNAWLVMAGAFVIGLLGGWLAARALGGTSSASLLDAGVSVREGGYKLISPLLLCEASLSREFIEYTSLKAKVDDAISESTQAGQAENVSVYYRDLSHGHWFGVNEDEHYDPASLLKVPTMIAVLKLAEIHPEMLSRRVLYDGSFDDNSIERIKPRASVEAGKTYTVDELLKYMIAYSDNNATQLLHQNIDPSSLKEVFTDLGLTFPEHGPGVDFMSAKSYSFFFRVLYNATYLNRAMSEKALEYLIEPDFPQGLQAGIPPDVAVAQKFGERAVERNDAIVQELHDCGIVYYPGYPYLLCVMTKGRDLDNLAGVIRSISRLVYEEAKKEYGR